MMFRPLPARRRCRLERDARPGPDAFAGRRRRPDDDIDRRRGRGAARAKVTFAGHGESHDYEGPLLIDVLAKVGAPTGQALRRAALADVVMVEASDGYRGRFRPGRGRPRHAAQSHDPGGPDRRPPLSATDGPFG
ncbi:hypothetical protein ACRAWD_12515 [Caulobacter segnis]